MRDGDRTILQYLSQAQMCIKSINKQQQHSLKVHCDVQKRHIYGSTEDLNKTQQLVGTGPNDKYGTLASNITRPFISSGALCTSPTMTTPVTLSANDGYDDMFNSFFGEQVAFSKSSHFSFELNDQLFTGKEEMETKQGIKMESKKENCNSAVSEIQMLRKQLQQETRRELEKFDKAFDPPKLLDVSDDKKSYRHSILNRMDEILNLKTHVEGESSHVRQYSEPIMTGCVSEWAISNTANSNQNKPNSKLESQSFRYPSKQTGGITRSDSAGFSKGAGKVRSGSATHYDTTVIGKRRSRPSSRNSTLERQQNHPLHYSIDSLNENSGSDQNISDQDSPEHKIGQKHRVTPLMNTPQRHSSIDSDSPEIHPELSPLSPLLSHIDPYTMTSQAFEEYISNGAASRVEKELVSGSRSTPLSRKNGITTSKDTWL